MFAASTLTPKQIRRASLIIFVVGIALMAATMFIGPEIKGAKRWLQIGFVSIQPSEFVKPAFVVLTAWLFNESQKRQRRAGHRARARALRHLRAAARAAARFRPDAARQPCVDARCSSWPASISFWIGALGFAGHCRYRVGLFSRAACGLAHRPLPQSGLRRHLPGRQGARLLPAWRLVRPRPWRRHGQGRAPRLAHRLHLRRSGRGIWPDRLPHLARCVCLHRAARPVQGVAGA